VTLKLAVSRSRPSVLYGANLLLLESSLLLDCMFRTRKVPTQIFVNVRCPILHIKTNSTLQCWCGLASNILKKSRLNWKQKISNTADNAGITQSQACDNRYRRVQELSSLFISK